MLHRFSDLYAERYFVLRSAVYLNRHLSVASLPNVSWHPLSPSESWPRTGPEQIQRTLLSPPPHRDSSRREQRTHWAETQTGLCRATTPTAAKVPLRPASLSTRCPQRLRNVGTPQASFWPGPSRKVGSFRRRLKVPSSLTQGLRKRLNMQRKTNCRLSSIPFGKNLPCPSSYPVSMYKVHLYRGIYTLYY